jgi:hypothetical protein
MKHITEKFPATFILFVHWCDIGHHAEVVAEPRPFYKYLLPSSLASSVLKTFSNAPRNMKELLLVFTKVLIMMSNRNEIVRLGHTFPLLTTAFQIMHLHLFMHTL